MGNQASAQTPSPQGKARLQRVCDEAGKLFAMELEEERHPDGSYRTTTGHRAQPGRDSNSRNHQPNNNQTVTLQSVLAAASRGIDLGHDPEEDSDSTRDTCDSPLFLTRPPRRQRGAANLSHDRSETKIQPDSLLSHLFHSGSHHRARHSHCDTTKAKTRSSSKTKKEDMIVTGKSNKTHQPLHGPTFPELNHTESGGSSQHHQHLCTPVVKIPRRKQHLQARVEEEEEEHLKRLYDSRTWNMYHRITEARARSSTSSSHHIGNSSSTMIAGGPSYPTFGGGGSGSITSAADPTQLQLQQHQQLGYADKSPEDEEHELMLGDLEE